MTITGVAGESLYRLTDMVGRTVKSGTLHVGSDIINMKNITPGVYALEVTEPSSGIRTTKRVVKE